MKLRTPIIILLLLIFSFLVSINSSIIVKPFYYLKDLILSVVHATQEEIVLSSEMKDNLIDNLKEEIKALQQVNNLHLSISDYNIINATIIERNRSYWFNDLTVNVGEKDGVKLDMAVIDSNGLIGRISSVNNHTATVKLITTNDIKSKISAVIKHKDKDIYGIINGYDSINNLLYLTINEDVKIESNTKVETTGMGGVFPRGIMIGKVYDVIKKSDQVTNVVRVLLSANIKGERYVGILQRKKISTD